MNFDRKIFGFDRTQTSPKSIMSNEFIKIENADKTFPLGGGKEYNALKGINLTIKQGEFISLIGHSGCGKSTLLNMIAGLDLATGGMVQLEGLMVSGPGPDRMVVFQNYSLLPWLTVRSTISLRSSGDFSVNTSSTASATLSRTVKIGRAHV